MCTLVVSAQRVPGFPLVVVANRDEMLDRASSGPRAWSDGPLRFVAPRDEVAGGTWLGWNEAGVFVGITNRYLGPRDATRASRGSLVVDALAYGSAREIHAAMRRVEPTRFNGFHLVYADEREVLATVSDGRELAQLVLGAGLSIVTERSFGAGDDRGRVRRILASWARVSAGVFDPSRLAHVLAEHDDDPMSATCVHLDDARYGTRSSMILAAPRREPPSAATMLWAGGPPCQTPFGPIALASMFDPAKRAEPVETR